MGTGIFLENEAEKGKGWRQRAAQLLSSVVALVLVVGLMPALAFADYGPDGEEGAPPVGSLVAHKKTGVAIDYTVLKNSGNGEQGEAMLGYGSLPAIPVDATGTVFVPKDVCIVYAWEKSCVYEVTKIAANAFAYGETQPAFDTVLIEGDVVLEKGALSNLPASINFKTYSKATEQALIEAGLPADRVTYEPLDTRYVVFGDSISAGYALTEEYNASASDVCDSLPTPPGTFTTLTGAMLNEKYGTTLVDNQSMSGWTSEQLLAQLNRGDYNAALANADMVSVTIGSNDLLGRFMEIIGEAVEKTLEDIKIQSGLTDEELELLRNAPEQSLLVDDSKKSGQAGDSLPPEEGSGSSSVIGAEDQTTTPENPTKSTEGPESSLEGASSESGQSDAQEPLQQGEKSIAADEVEPIGSGQVANELKTSDDLGKPIVEASGLEEQQKEVSEDESIEGIRKKLPHIFPILVKNINDAVIDDAQLLAACENFKTKTQPKILNKLHELAPQATVYWTTLYNPFYDTQIKVGELFPIIQQLNPTENLTVDLGGPGEIYISKMNEAFEVNSTGYHAVDLFTPLNNHGLTNVDIGKEEGELHFNIDPHPNADGHMLISEILNERIASTYRMEPAPGPKPEPGPSAGPVVPIVPTEPSEPMLAATGDSLASLPFVAAVLFVTAVGCLVVARRYGAK